MLLVKFTLLTIGLTFLAFLVILVAVNHGISKMNKEYDRKSREHFYPYNMYTDDEVRK